MKRVDRFANSPNQDPKFQILNSKFLFCGVVILAALGIALPTVAATPECNTAVRQFGASLQGICENSCTGNQLAPSTMAQLFPGPQGTEFYAQGTPGGTLCGSTQTCCTQTRSAVCLTALRQYDSSLTGSCQSACPQGASRYTSLVSGRPEPCGSGQVCCTTAGSTVSSCVNLPGVTATCKSSANQNEVDTSQSTWWSDQGLLSGCSGAICAVQKGTELCQGIALRAFSVSGRPTSGASIYACATVASDCEDGTTLSQTVSVAAGACPGSQVCCVPKEGTKLTTTGSAQPNVAKTLPDPLQGANIQTLIGNVIRTAAGIAGSLALLYFVYGGIMYILSGGQQDKVKTATQIIRNAAIGVILIFAAYMIVSSVLGVILAE